PVRERPPRRRRRWGWPLLIGALAAAGILLAVADIAAGGSAPNPMTRAFTGSVVVRSGLPATPASQTVAFDRSQIGDRFTFDSPIGGLGPLNPYQAVRAFLSSGAGLVLLALAGLVVFPTRARNAVERLEARHGSEIAVAAGLVMGLLTLAAMTLLRLTLVLLAAVP